MQIKELKAAISKLTDEKKQLIEEKKQHDVSLEKQATSRQKLIDQLKAIADDAVSKIRTEERETVNKCNEVIDIYTKIKRKADEEIEHAMYELSKRTKTSHC